MNTQKRFPKLLLCITLILAFIVSGITRPGFLLPFFEPQVQEVEEDYDDPDPAGEEAGNSRAFDITPDSGFRIYAEENALDRDREFVVTRLGDDKLKELMETALSYDELGCFPVIGWDMDAGMEPDIRMPGVFHMEFDLVEYGIPEDMYPLVSAYHIDDEGKWEELAGEVVGSVLHVEASHNGLITLAIAGRILLYATLAGLVGYMVYNQNNPERDYFTNPKEYDVYEFEKSGEVKMTDEGATPVVEKLGKKIYTIKFNLSEQVVYWQKKKAEIEAEAYRSSEEEAIESMKRDYGEDYLQNPDVKYAYVQTVIRHVKLCQEKLAANEKYGRSIKGLNSALEGNGYTWESAYKLAVMVRTAYYYLKDVVKVKVPTNVPYIMVTPSTVPGKKGTQSDQTNQFFPSMRSFTVLRVMNLGMSEKADADILSSLTHEMAHQCQREYCNGLLARAKYDEACAQLLEEQAYEYYKSHTITISPGQKGITATFSEVQDGSGIMKALPELKNGQDYKYYSCEMDSSASYTWLSSASSDFRHNYGSNTDEDESKIPWYQTVVEYAYSEDSSMGYPYARFLDFLWKDYDERAEQKMTWHRLFNMYDGSLPRPSLSTLLKKAFGLTDAGLSRKYREFAEANKTVFYGYDLKGKGQYYNPTIGSKTENGGKIKLKNQNYTIMTRYFEPYFPEGYNKQASLVLKQDAGFKDTFSDMTLIPVGNTNCETCKDGLFYNPQSIESLAKGAILEVDGGTHGVAKSTWNFLSWKKKAEGYSLWTLLAPDEIRPELKDGQIAFKMPYKSDAAKAKVVDGYRVTVTPSTSPENPHIEYLDLDISGKERSINLKEFFSEELIERAEREDLVDSVNFTVSVCEFVKDADGKRHFGPESNPGGGMSALLKEMGAHEGRVTITLHWFGPDDLDLHCITPQGGHISFDNKEADGGYLDVDMNISGDRSESVEHIYFDKPDAGDYKVYIDNYTDRTDGDTRAEIYISVEGKEIIADTANLGSSSKTWTVRTYSATKKESGAEYLIAEPVNGG